MRNGHEVLLTERNHGSAANVHDGTCHWVKSRNFYQSRRRACQLSSAARQHELERRLRATLSMAAFGEVYGHFDGSALPS